MKQSIFLGIDIGKNGAVSAINTDGAIIRYHPMPQCDGDIALFELFSILYDLNLKYDIKQCAIEDVHSIFGVSAKANFQFGRSLGIIEGILAGLNIGFIKVTPKVWQKVAFNGIDEIRQPSTGVKKGKIETKKMALMAAQKFWPGETFFASKRSRVAHDGIVDSILIAKYLQLSPK